MIQNVSVSGLNIRYYDEGSGSVLLFLHGWGASFTVYECLLSHLSRKYRVIAPDLPGVGGSEEPAEVWNLDNYIQFVLDFLAALQLSPDVLVGHSHGGRVILKLLGDRRLPVSRVVLLASAGLKPRRTLAYYLKVYSYKTARFCLKPFPKARERLIKRAGSADYRAASPVMRGTLSRVVNVDLTNILPRIQVPVLLIWGENDTATPLRDGKKMESLIPDAGLVTLKGGSHYAFLEHWPQVARVLDSFLGPSKS